MPISQQLSLVDLNVGGKGDENDDGVRLRAFQKSPGLFVELFSRFGGKPVITCLNLRKPNHCAANRQRRRLIWPELAWSLCVPVFTAKQDEPAFVVVVEGEERVAAEAPDLESVINLLSEGINTIFEEPLKRLAGLGYSWA